MMRRRVTKAYEREGGRTYSVELVLQQDHLVEEEEGLEGTAGERLVHLGEVADEELGGEEVEARVELVEVELLAVEDVDEEVEEGLAGFASVEEEVLHVGDVDGAEVAVAVAPDRAEEAEAGLELGEGPLLDLGEGAYRVVLVLVAQGVESLGGTQIVGPLGCAPARLEALPIVCVVGEVLLRGSTQFLRELVVPPGRR